MFDGGYYAETLPGTAALTLLMLKEGAAGKSSETIAEALDYHGAWLQTSASSHYLYVTLYTLNRHLDTCVSLLADIVARPDFPQPAWFYEICDELGLYVIDRANLNAPSGRSDRTVGGTPVAVFCRRKSYTFCWLFVRRSIPTPRFLQDFL